MKKFKFLIALLPVLIMQSCNQGQNEDIVATGEEIDKYLQVPSPEWEDQILYFIVTDRFMDGDPSNNDQGAGEYKPGSGGHWNGGDLKGITQKLGYIKELGATGIWITPPVANQWVNPQRTGTGNHGYWANNFIEVDKHLGSLADYKQLSASLHKNGMYLIQDVVCNHLGDFYTYTGPYDQNDVTKNFKLHDVPQPTQYPFTHNDANNPEDLAMDIYHFAPSFHDHSDTIKKRKYQFADLDDLNTSNPVVREALRSSYNFWIREAGVDGFRFDTPHMVEHEFWHDFIHSKDPASPGVENFARSLGKQQFMTLGETVVWTLPFDEGGTLAAARYLGSADKPEMTSVLNFPLTFELGRVFKNLQSTSMITYRLESLNEHFPRPELLLNFIDNHDGARFLTGASHSSFRQALLFIMTIPGIPIIYYGTEQELLGMRQAMFRGGAGSPDMDHFITDNESFRFMQDLIRYRKENDIFRRGELKVLRDAPGGPGLFVYEMRHQDENAIVLMNTSEALHLADNIHTGLEPGRILESFYSLSGNVYRLKVDGNGNINLMLEPKEGIILFPSEDTDEPVITGKSIIIDPMIDLILTGEMVTVSGPSNDIDMIDLMVDGNYSRKIAATIKPGGQWSADVPLVYLVNGKHRITAFSFLREAEENIVSDYIEFELELPAVTIGKMQDLKGDDNGPNGTYTYPANPSFRGQMDIETVKVYRMGSNLKVDVTMTEITQIWLPPNGFDHALINIYLDLPDQEGVRALPFQNAEMPGQSAWNYLVSTAGFGNSVFSSEGASATDIGSATGPAASVSVDTETRTISFFITSEALGHPEKLSGSKIYITTWDGGPGQPRALSPEGGEWTFGGGSNSDPRIMDDTELIILE